MMEDIRIGDRVVCIDRGIFKEYLTIGGIYEIVEYDLHSYSIRVYSNDGRARWYDTYQFDCVTLKRNDIINEILK